MSLVPLLWPCIWVFQEGFAEGILVLVCLLVGYVYLHVFCRFEDTFNQLPFFGGVNANLCAILFMSVLLSYFRCVMDKRRMEEAKKV